MTESANLKAGEYFLRSFKIYKLDEPEQFIDISALIHHWNLVESMDAGFIRGSAKIYDSVGLLDEFLGEDDGWLKGEEEIEVVYEDFFKTKNREKYFVYAITDVKSAKRGNEAVYEYTLHFVSKEKFYGDRQKVRRGYSNGKISDYVQEVFDEYFQSDKTIDIQETEGTVNLVVPYYTPEQTMHFFSRKAFSGQETQNAYRFFENREGFYFKSHEGLVEDFNFDLDGAPSEGNISQLPTFFRQEFVDQTPEGQVKLMSSLIEIEYPKYVNTFEDMNKGAYYSMTSELDILNRTVTFNEYRHLDEYQTHIYPDSPRDVRSKHSKEFIDTHMLFPKNNLVVKDYSDTAVSPYLRKNMAYPLTYNQKNVSLYHHENESLKIKVYGRNTINAGDIINLQLTEVHFAVEQRRDDKERSGFYLVEEVYNEFYENSYHQTLIVSKSGYKGKQEERNSNYRQYS